MAIDLCGNIFEQLGHHVGHKLRCVEYGGGINRAIECETCGTVLIDQDNPSHEIEDTRAKNRRLEEAFSGTRFTVNVTEDDGHPFGAATFYVTPGDEPLSYYVSTLDFDSDTIGTLYSYKGEDADESDGDGTIDDGVIFRGCYYFGAFPTRADFIRLSKFGAC